MVAHKLAISYSRVSTGQQAGEDRSGEERQQRVVESWLAQHPDYELDRQVKVTVSGAKAGRFEWFISELEKGVLPRGTCLVVEMVSRFSREPIEDVLKTLIRLWDAGGAVAFCEHGGKVLTGFDPQSGDVFVVIGSIQRARAEWLERQARALGAATKKREAQKQGTYKPRGRSKKGQADYPFWLDVDKEGVFVLNDWAAHVRTIFKLAPTMGVTRIATYLDSQGVRAVSDGRKRWKPTSVKWVLRNEAAIGFKVFWRGDRLSEEKVLAYPPVVTQEEWDAAQTALNQRSKALPSNSSPTQANLFSGAIYCRHCGSPMILKASGGVPHRYLRCRNDYSICTHRGHQYKESFLLQHLARYRWEDFFNTGVQEAALTSARSSLLEAEKALRLIEVDIGKVDANISKLTTSDDPSLLSVLPQFSKRLNELMADRNLAQVKVDTWKGEVSKLTHQQTGREAERALKRQIDGFLSGEENSLEQRVAFNSWLRDQNLVLCVEDGHDEFDAADRLLEMEHPIAKDMPPAPADEMKALIHVGEPFFDQGRLVMVNCLLETMKDNKAFEKLPDSLMNKVHDHYKQLAQPSDPEAFQKKWDATVDKGWPTVDLIGFRAPSEIKYWQDVLASGGNDEGSMLEGHVGLVEHGALKFGGEFQYEGGNPDWFMPTPWTSREKRKRGRPAKRKRSS